jgi:RNA polymerase-binding transcription factor DksA
MLQRLEGELMGMEDALVRTLEGRLKARVMQLRDIVQSRWDRLGEAVSPTTAAGAAGARLDQEDPDDEREVPLLRRTQFELDEVLAALQRVKQGVYGRCGACDEAIEVHRLRVMPEARPCARCQRSIEGRGTAQGSAR